MPLHGNTSAVVTCVVDDHVTKIGEGPVSCSHNVTLVFQVPVIDTNRCGCAHKRSRCQVCVASTASNHTCPAPSPVRHLLFLASSDSSGSDGAGLARVASAMTPRPSRSLSSRTGPEPTGVLDWTYGQSTCSSIGHNSSTFCSCMFVRMFSVSAFGMILTSSSLTRFRNLKLVLSPVSLFSRSRTRHDVQPHTCRTRL